MGWFDRFRRSSAPPPPPGDDLAIAEAAWASGDENHAARHVARVLHDDPMSAGAHHLVRAMAARPNAADRYAPLAQGGQYLGDVLLRAALHGEAGDYGDAISLSIQSLALVPELPLATWVTRWAAEPAFARTELDSLLAAFSHALDPELAEHAMQPAIVDMLDAVRAHFPDNDHLMFVHARLSRQAGLHDKSLSIAQTFHRRRPTHVSAVMCYGALKRLGRVDDALAMIDEAIALATDASSRRSAWTDRADTLLDAARWDEAATAYRKALELEPDHPWCRSSLAFLAAREGDATAREQLRRFARDKEPRAAELVARLERRADLPAPGSAIVNVLVQVLAQSPEPPPQSGSIKMTLSAPEPPAALLAARAELQRRGWRVDMTLEVDDVPEPDPRVALADDAYVLWKFAGHEPRPAIDPPPPPLAAAIAELARTTFDADDWLQRATQLDATWRQLAAVMVHPPAPPEGFTWWDWWYRVDVAAALAIAQLDGGRDALFALVRGPNDWSGHAAVVVLERLALRDQTIAVAILNDLVTHAETHQPSFGDVCVWEAARRAIIAIDDAYGITSA